MADVPNCTLGDAILDTSRGVSFALASGVEPVMEVFEMDAGEAEKILPGGKSQPLTLKMETEGGVVTFSNLYVVGEVAAQDPFRRALVVADRRIWWRRNWSFRRMNIRRRTGITRRPDAGGVPDQIQQVIQDLQYARWSTANESGQPYRAAQALRKALEDADPGAPVTASGSFPEKSIDHQEIDGPGPESVQYALSLLSGADLYVGYGGQIAIYDALDQDKVDEILAALGGEYVGSESVARVNLSGQRPSSINVLWSVEQELRVDSLESGDYAQDRDIRGMENVAPCPDGSLTIPGGRKVFQGEYLTFDQLFAAWNTDLGNAPPISHDVVRRFYLTPHLEALYGGLGLLVASANWSARIACIRAHYRQTWRIKRGWMDRIFSLRPYRVGVIDQETGTFAPAVAYAGYCIIPSTKGILSGDFQQHLMLNVDGSVAAGASLSGGRIAPCRVQVVDEELGIIRLDYQLDLLGNYRQIIPSKVENVPTGLVSQSGQPISMDGSVYGRGGVGVSLSQSNRVSILLTACPSAPNSKAQLFPVSVSASAALKYLSDVGARRVLPSTGPAWDLRVFPGLATARFAWSDEKAQAIERSFGVGLKADAPGVGERKDLADLLQNPSEVADLSEALAAGLYASLADHAEGTWRGAFAPGLVPTGNIRRVTHTVSPAGVPSTMVSMPGTLAPLDAMAVLPSSARRLFLRLAQPGGAK